MCAELRSIVRMPQGILYPKPKQTFVSMNDHDFTSTELSLWEPLLSWHPRLPFGLLGPAATGVTELAHP